MFMRGELSFNICGGMDHGCMYKGEGSFNTNVEDGYVNEGECWVCVVLGGIDSILKVGALCNFAHNPFVGGNECISV